VSKDTIQRAQEIIDNDAEEAQARLQQHAAPGTTVTMTDVMSLMQQMTQMVTATMQGFQAQIEDLKAGQRKPGQKTPPTEEDLQRWADQESYLRQYWASEEQVQFYVKPTLEETRARDSVKAREFPKRLFQVNGVGYWLTVGKVAAIPRSIADRLEEAQDGYRPVHHDAPDRLPQIPDPPHIPWAESMGRPGNVGEGPLDIPPSAVPLVGRR
jgi:hypothetical protein